MYLKLGSKAQSLTCKKGWAFKRYSLWQCAWGRKREVCLHDRIFKEHFSLAYGIEWSRRNRNNARNIRKRLSEKIKVQQSRALFICIKYSVLISFNTVKCLKQNQCKCPSLFFIIIPDTFTREAPEETKKWMNARQSIVRSTMSKITKLFLKVIWFSKLSFVGKFQKQYSSLKISLGLSFTTYTNHWGHLQRSHGQIAPNA